MATIEPYGSGSVRTLTFLVKLGDLAVWFSYGKAVAYQIATRPGPVVRGDARGAWQEKHLDAIDGGSRRARNARMPRDEFDAALQTVLEVLEGLPT